MISQLRHELQHQLILSDEQHHPTRMAVQPQEPPISVWSTRIADKSLMRIQKALKKSVTQKKKSLRLHLKKPSVVVKQPNGESGKN